MSDDAGTGQTTQPMEPVAVPASNATPAQTQTDEAALMHAVARGDHGAFRALVARHLDPLHSYALRLTGSKSLAEDLLQDIWLTVWQKAERYKPRRGSLSTWLHSLLHNRFVDQQRKRQPHYDTDVVEWALDSHATDQAGLHVEEAKRLQTALQRLPVNQKAALLLAHSQGFSNPEVAGILGQSVRAVESLQARGRRRLKQELANLSSDHERQS